MSALQAIALGSIWKEVDPRLTRFVKVLAIGVGSAPEASGAAPISTPIIPNESTADYIPTQILAEAFRKHGYDGIVYKSLIGKRANVALFNTSTADVTSRFLYEVDSISFGFRKHADSIPISQELLDAPMQH